MVELNQDRVVPKRADREEKGSVADGAHCRHKSSGGGSRVVMNAGRLVEPGTGNRARRKRGEASVLNGRDRYEST